MADRHKGGAVAVELAVAAVLGCAGAAVGRITPGCDEAIAVNRRHGPGGGHDLLLARGGGFARGAAGKARTPGADRARGADRPERAVGGRARLEVVGADAGNERRGGRKGACADAGGVAPGLDRAIDLLRREAATVSEDAHKAGAGGRAGSGGAKGAAVGGVAPNDDTAIVFDGGKRGAGSGNHLVAGARRFAGGAVAAKAPRNNRAVVFQRCEGLLVGGDGGVAGAGGGIRLLAAVGGVAPHRYRAGGAERRKGGQVAELLAGGAQSVGAAEAGARARALAGQRVAGGDIELEELHRAASGIGGRDIHIFVNRGADAHLAADHAGGGVEAQAWRQHAIGGDHHILDGVEVVVGGAGSAREAEGPQRFICGLPIAVIPGIIRQHIVHPHLHAPFGAHRHGHGDEVVVADKRVGDGGGGT